jgi:hypothetical protein
MDEHKKAKENFIDGDFHIYFGIASQQKLREEGCIRPHGPYPYKAPFGTPAETKAHDFFYPTARPNTAQGTLNGRWIS